MIKLLDILKEIRIKADQNRIEGEVERSIHQDFITFPLLLKGSPRQYPKTFSFTSEGAIAEYGNISSEFEKHKQILDDLRVKYTVSPGRNLIYRLIIPIDSIEIIKDQDINADDDLDEIRIKPDTKPLLYKLRTDSDGQGWLNFYEIGYEAFYWEDKIVFDELLDIDDLKQKLDARGIPYEEDNERNEIYVDIEYTEKTK